MEAGRATEETTPNIGCTLTAFGAGKKGRFAKFLMSLLSCHPGGR
jgi:hypothetical protein